MLRYLELRVTEEDTLLYQFVCWTPNAFCFFFVFLRSITFLYSLLVLEYLLLVRRAHICTLRDVQKEYHPICTEKDSLLRAVHKRAHEQQKRSSRAAFQRFTLFTHFFHFPFSVFRLFIYSNDCHSTHLCITRRSDDWGEIVPRDVEKKSSRRCRFHRHPSRWDAVSRDVDGTKDEEFVPTPRDRDAVSRSQRTDANDDVQRNREMAGEF